MMRMAGSMLVLAIVPLMAWRSPVVGGADVATLRKQVDILDADTRDLQTVSYTHLTLPTILRV